MAKCLGYQFVKASGKAKKIPENAPWMDVQHTDTPTVAKYWLPNFMESKYLAFRFGDEGQYTPLARSSFEVRVFHIDQSILKLSYNINHQPKGNLNETSMDGIYRLFFLPMFPPFVQVTHAEGFVLFPGAVWKLGEILQEVGPKTTFHVGRPFFRCHVSFREGKTQL